MSLETDMESARQNIDAADILFKQLENSLYESVDPQFFVEPREFRSLIEVLNVLGEKVDDQQRNSAGANLDSDENFLAALQERNNAYKRLLDQRTLVNESIEQVVQFQHGGLNNSVDTMSEVVREYNKGRKEIAGLRKSLHETHSVLTAKKKGQVSLRELWLKKMETEESLRLVRELESLKNTPHRVQRLMQQRRHLGAVNCLNKAISGMFHEDLVAVSGLSGIRETLMDLKESLLDTCVAELRDVIIGGVDDYQANEMGSGDTETDSDDGSDYMSESVQSRSTFITQGQQSVAGGGGGAGRGRYGGSTASGHTTGTSISRSQRAASRQGRDSDARSMMSSSPRRAGKPLGRSQAGGASVAGRSAGNGSVVGGGGGGWKSATGSARNGSHGGGETGTGYLYGTTGSGGRGGGGSSSAGGYLNGVLYGGNAGFHRMDVMFGNSGLTGGRVIASLAAGASSPHTWPCDMKDLDEKVEASLVEPSSTGTLYIRLLVRTGAVLQYEEDMERMLLETVPQSFRTVLVTRMRDNALLKLQMHVRSEQRRKQQQQQYQQQQTTAGGAGSAGSRRRVSVFGFEESDEMHIRLCNEYISSLLDACLLTMNRLLYVLKLLAISKAIRKKQAEKLAGLGKMGQNSHMGRAMSFSAGKIELLGGLTAQIDAAAEREGGASLNSPKDRELSEDVAVLSDTLTEEEERQLAREVSVLHDSPNTRKGLLAAWSKVEECILREMNVHLVEPELESIMDHRPGYVKRVTYRVAGAMRTTARDGFDRDDAEGEDDDAEEEDYEEEEEAQDSPEKEDNRAVLSQALGGGLGGAGRSRQQRGRARMIFKPSSRHAAAVYKRVVTYSLLVARMLRDSGYTDGSRQGPSSAQVASSKRGSASMSAGSSNTGGANMPGNSVNSGTIGAYYTTNSRENVLLIRLQTFLEEELLPVVQSSVNQDMRDLQLNNRLFSICVAAGYPGAVSGDSSSGSSNGGSSSGGSGMELGEGSERSAGVLMNRSLCAIRGDIGGASSGSLPQPADSTCCLSEAALLCAKTTQPLFTYWIQLNLHRAMVSTIIDRVVRGYTSAAKEELENLTFSLLTATLAREKRTTPTQDHAHTLYLSLQHQHEHEHHRHEHSQHQTPRPSPHSLSHSISFGSQAGVLTPRSGLGIQTGFPSQYPGASGQQQQQQLQQQHMSAVVAHPFEALRQSVLSDPLFKSVYRPRMYAGKHSYSEFFETSQSSSTSSSSTSIGGVGGGMQSDRGRGRAGDSNVTVGSGVGGSSRGGGASGFLSPSNGYPARQLPHTPHGLMSPHFNSTNSSHHHHQQQHRHRISTVVEESSEGSSSSLRNSMSLDDGVNTIWASGGQKIGESASTHMQFVYQFSDFGASWPALWQVGDPNYPVSSEKVLTDFRTLSTLASISHGSDWLVRRLGGLCHVAIRKAAQHPAVTQLIATSHISAKPPASSSSSSSSSASSSLHAHAAHAPISMSHSHSNTQLSSMGGGGGGGSLSGSTMASASAAAVATAAAAAAAQKATATKLARQEIAESKSNLYESVVGGAKELSKLGEDALIILRGELQLACFYFLHKLAHINYSQNPLSNHASGISGNGPSANYSNPSLPSNGSSIYNMNNQNSFSRSNMHMFTPRSSANSRARPLSTSSMSAVAINDPSRAPKAGGNPEETALKTGTSSFGFAAAFRGKTRAAPKTPAYAPGLLGTASTSQYGFNSLAAGAGVGVGVGGGAHHSYGYQLPEELVLSSFTQFLHMYRDSVATALSPWAFAVCLSPICALIPRVVMQCVMHVLLAASATASGTLRAGVSTSGGSAAGNNNSSSNSNNNNSNSSGGGGQHASSATDRERAREKERERDRERNAQREAETSFWEQGSTFSPTPASEASAGVHGGANGGTNPGANAASTTHSGALKSRLLRIVVSLQQGVMLYVHSASTLHPGRVSGGGGMSNERGAAGDAHGGNQMIENEHSSPQQLSSGFGRDSPSPATSPHPNSSMSGFAASSLGGVGGGGRERDHEHVGGEDAGGGGVTAAAGGGVRRNHSVYALEPETKRSLLDALTDEFERLRRYVSLIDMPLKELKLYMRKNGGEYSKEEFRILWLRTCGNTYSSPESLFAEFCQTLAEEDVGRQAAEVQAQRAEQQQAQEMQRLQQKYHKHGLGRLAP